MAEHGKSRILVTDGTTRLVGIISLTDVVTRDSNKHAVALLLMDRGRARTLPLFQWLACDGGLIALLATAGYVYGSPPLYRATERNWGDGLAEGRDAAPPVGRHLVGAAGARPRRTADARGRARADAAARAAGAVRGAAVRARPGAPGAQREGLAADGGGAPRRRRHAVRRRLVSLFATTLARGRRPKSGCGTSSRAPRIRSSTRRPTGSCAAGAARPSACSAIGPRR